MDEQVIWKVLGIEPTKSEEELKRRYYELLTSVNPEDDPEGFKRLRQAYEAAVELAERPEEEAEEVAKDEIDEWLDRVYNVYRYADSRNNPELWKELFQDDICLALDTAMEARERFIAFLMGHVYVDHEIWQLIDREFHIVEDVEELQESFPKDFLDYIVYQIENESFFAYDLLEVQALDEDTLNLDDYIMAYLRCKADIDRENYDNMWQRLDDLRAFEVYHPYEDVERIRISIVDDKIEDATALAEKLLMKVPDDVYAGYWSGCAWWKAGQWEKAYECWNHVVEVLPDHYSSRVGLAEYYIKVKEYVKAKDLIMELLESNGRDNYTLDLMRDVNVPLIEYYKELAEKEEYKKNMVEACWCMFQNEMFTETLDCLASLDIQKSDEEYYDYVNMKGRCYLGLEQYEKAVDYLLLWENAREMLEDDGSDKYKKRISREGFIKSAIGVAYQNLKNYEMAEKYLLEGISKEPDDNVRHSFMDRLALLYYDRGQCPNCIDTCTRIIEEDPGYYPAYLRRQQAAFDYQDWQQVVDDYYNAIRIFPKYYKPYLLAIQVFCIYHQYEDAKKVLELAREYEVQHDMLDFYNVRVKRNLADSDEEIKAVLSMCHDLQEKLRDKQEQKIEDKDKTEIELLDEDLKKDGMPQDKVDAGDLAFEEILLHMDLEQYDLALQHVEAEIKGGNRNYRLRWIRADIYRIRREYDRAIKEYEELKHEIPENADIVFNYGLCLERMGRTDEAILNFQEVICLEPKHPKAHYELMRIHSRRFDDYELKSSYREAIAEATKQLELVQSAYYYIERGLLYMDNFNFDQAIADYRKALELEPNNIYAYNNIGYVYQAKGDFEEALTYFEKSISLMTKDEHTLLPYVNSAKCYQAMQQWDKAIQILDEALKEFKPTYSILSKQIELYTIKKDPKKVTELCDSALKRNLISIGDYYNKIAEAYIIAGNFSEGKKVMAKWKSRRVTGTECEKTQQKYDVLEAYGIYYFYHRELKASVKCLEEAVKIARKNGLDYTRAGTHLANAYYMHKQYVKAANIAKMTMADMVRENHVPQRLKALESEDPESLEYYLSYRPLAPLRMFRVALLYIGMGELDKAEKMLTECCQVPRCRHCAFKTCYDAILIRANIEEIRGNIEEAIRLYETAQEINPSDLEPTLTLDVLRNRKGDHK